MSSRARSSSGTSARRPLGAGLLVALTVALPAPVRRVESRPVGAVVGTVTVRRPGLSGALRRDHAGVVVLLPGLSGTPAPLRAPAVMRQRDKAFLPRVVAVPTGSAVSFPNEDKIFHNVFSLSDAAKFDLGLYKSGTSKTVVFERPGVVQVYCNIHPEMVATIRVVDTPYYAVTDPSGAFRIGDVPPGTHPIVAWLPRSEEGRGTVTVVVGATARIQLEGVEGSAPARHMRKDGTPYGRYQ